MSAPTLPTGVRACWRCRHYRLRERRAWCVHPAYRVATPWLEAIERGQPCGGDHAPLFEALSDE